MSKVSALTLILPAMAMAAGGGLFSYDPDSPTNPTSWAAIDMEGNQCGGSKQSGIDVPRTGCDVYDDYIYSAGSCTLDDIVFALSDHAVFGHYNTTNCKAPRMIVPGFDAPFDALQFHIHTGTDHAIGGHYYGADMHLVHKLEGQEQYSVLGFFLDPTNPSNIPMFEDVLTEFEIVENSVATKCGGGSIVDSGSTSSIVNSGGNRNLRDVERKLQRSFNPYDLVPKGATIYTYDGGLTTPPCSEVVYWNVVDTPVSISVAEYLRFANLVLDYVDPETCELASVAAPSGFTGRPVQAINGRTITRHCPTAMQPDESA